MTRELLKSDHPLLAHPSQISPPFPQTTPWINFTQGWFLLSLVVLLMLMFVCVRLVLISYLLTSNEVKYHDQQLMAVHVVAPRSGCYLRLWLQMTLPTQDESACILDICRTFVLFLVSNSHPNDVFFKVPPVLDCWAQEPLTIFWRVWSVHIHMDTRCSECLNLCLWKDVMFNYYEGCHFWKAFFAVF